MVILRMFAYLLLYFLSGLILSANDSLRLADLVDTYRQRQGFSGTILVAKEGQVVYHESFGLAYRSRPDSIKNDYHFSVASVTKLLTAIRVLQLEEAGKISLETSIATYLPQFKALLGENITVHHLLLHLSGLPQEPLSIYRRPHDPEEMVREILTQKRAQAVGNFEYNNLDYMLLGLLIEKVSGQSYQDNIQDHVLRPLEMDDSGFLSYGHYPQKFAYTYSRRGKKLKQDVLFHIENCFAAGEMYSTAADLLRLDQALYSDVLLNATSRAKLAISNPQYGYAGYGVWNYNYPFVAEQPTVMERRGGILGANVVLVRLTDENYTIIILSNDDRFNPDSFGDEDNLREMLIRGLY